MYEILRKLKNIQITFINLKLKKTLIKYLYYMTSLNDVEKTTKKTKYLILKDINYDNKINNKHTPQKEHINK